MRAPVSAFIGLGANLGEPQAALRAALARIAEVPHTTLLRCSRIYRSAPVQAQGPDFFNAVAQVQTQLTAPALLHALQAIEQEAGRERPYRNAPRTLDLDLLLFGDASIWSAELVLPHPRMKERAFVLLPLQELAPGRVDARDLAAVADQRISPLPATSSPA